MKSNSFYLQSEALGRIGPLLPTSQPGHVPKIWQPANDGPHLVFSENLL